MITVAIDARKINDGGIGTYIRGLVQGLLELNEVKIQLIVRDSSVIPIEWQSHQLFCEPITTSIRCYSWQEYLRFPAINVDLFHSPHYTLPYALGIPSVVTVHDLIHIEAPEQFYYPYIAKPLIASALRRASAVVTVSHTSQSKIEHYFPFVRKKLYVVHNPVLEVRSDITLGAGYTSAKINVRHEIESFATTKKFYLGVFSNAKPHKRMSDLIRAFIDWKANHPDCQIELVLVGSGSEEYKRNYIDSTVSRSAPEGLHKEVTAFGRVSSDGLKFLYGRAQALVMPSRVEGFGLPVVEARAFGTPVIMTPCEALQELAVPGDIQMSDFSDESLHSAFDQLAHSPRRVGKEGLERFDPLHVARETLNVYTRALHLDNKYR